MTSAEALQLYGSQSKEYRTAHRREYRATRRRIDYLPYRAAGKALDMAIENGWAISQTDAINQALVAWVGWMSNDCPE